MSCAGTLVADDVGELRNLGLDRPPWIGRELAGLIDFPGFTVPPGTRRGVAPDAAAEAFVRALDGVVPLLEAELKRLERERGAATSRQVVQDLRRALKGLRDRLPQYELPAVANGEAELRDAAEAGIAPSGAEVAAGDGAGEEQEESTPGRDRTLEFFPPHPSRLGIEFGLDSPPANEGQTGIRIGRPTSRTLWTDGRTAKSRRHTLINCGMDGRAGYLDSFRVQPDCEAMGRVQDPHREGTTNERDFTPSVKRQVANLTALQRDLEK